MTGPINATANTVTLNKLVNLDLNGQSLTGNVTITSSKEGILNISAGTITGNLTVDAANATVNNAATVSGTITINNVSGNTWNENASNNNIVFNDPNPGTNFVVGAGQTVSSLTLNKPAIVSVTAGATVTALDIAVGANNTTVNNKGVITDITGSGKVEVVNTGTGEVKKATNTNVTTGDIANPDQELIKDAGLVEASGVHSATFTWSSKNGIGTKLVEKSGRYNYFNDGAYLDITVKKDAGNNLSFSEVFNEMTLVTDEGSTDSIKGTGGRQAEDWAGTDGAWKTKLKESGSKAVFYGVRQTGQSTDLGATRTVGFNAGDSRKIDLALTPKAELEAGTYTVTIQPKQQNGVTSGVNLGNAITYTITIPSSPVE